MTLRSIPDKIEWLRVTLQEVEQTMGAAHDSADLAELKRLLRDRIAELELERPHTVNQEWTDLYNRAS
jgi:hypothetical protein